MGEIVKAEAKAVVVVQRVRDMIVRLTPEIAAALPKHLSADRMARIFLTCCRRVPKLMDCSHDSLAGAMLQAAQLGLEPGDGLGQAYLIPYGTECQLQIGYQGLCELAMRSGLVRSIRAAIVYSDEESRWVEGTAPRVEHTPKVGRREAPKPEMLTYAYAVAELTNGSHTAVRVDPWEIDKIRATSLSAKKPSSPWNMWPEAMWMKSAVRRLCKLLPKSAELRAALEIDETAERGETPVALVDLPALADLPADPPAANGEVKQ